MRNISLKSVSARLSVTLLLLMGSMSASAQYYLNVYEKTGSNNQYEIANLDSVSISDVKEYTPVLTQLSISQSQVSLETGESATLTVKGYDGDGAEMTLENLKWKSSDYSVASVDENGVVRTYQSGSVDIVALQGDVTDTCTVIIKDHVYTLNEVVKLSLDKVALNVETGDGDSLSVRGFAADGVEIPLSNIQWKTNDASVATVTDNGVVKTLSSGQALIIASLGDIADTCKVTVVDHVYTLADVVKIVVDKDTIHLETGESDSLKVIGYASNGFKIPLNNILWRSSNNTVATVDENGYVITNKSGVTVITASFGLYSDSCTLSVMDHIYTKDDVVKIVIGKKELIIETGGSDTLTVMGYALDGTKIPIDDVVWASSNPTVASVDDNGILTANASGIADVTTSFGPFTDTCYITVQNKNGMYMGIMGFNISLYERQISLLDLNTKNKIEEFIDSMQMEDGTILCYSVDKAIDALHNTFIPDNLSTVAVVTFTDGLDKGSAKKIGYKPYRNSDDYLDGLKNRISTDSVAGIPVTAYSIGLRGGDVTDTTSFKKTLKKLASMDSYAMEVKDMQEVNNKFQEIAENLNSTINYQTVPVVIPGPDDGDRIRFTFDVSDKNPSSAAISSLYIEGTFCVVDSDPLQFILTDIKYKGMSSSISDSLVVGVEVDDYLQFTFEKVLTDDNTSLSNENVKQWDLTSDSTWQINSEFRSERQPVIENVKSSAIIMLVLDCSSSLGDEFKTIQRNAIQFVNTLYSASGSQVINNGGSHNTTIYSQFSKTPLDLSLAISKNGVRYYITQEQYSEYNINDATIEGLTVVTGSESFILSLQYETGVNLRQANAINYYGEKMPTKAQGEVISARWSIINNAIAAFGGSALSTSFWTGYNTSSYRYYVYAGGGSLGSTSSSTQTYPVRFVSSTSSVSPINWRDARDLTLVARKRAEQYNFTKDEWANIYNKSDYETIGVLVITGNEKFVISLNNELTDDMLQTNAISYYGSNLPSQSQGKIISARWSDIDNAIKSFGGTALSDSFWSGYKNSSYYYYVFSGNGDLGSSSSSSTKKPVRLIYPYYESVDLGLSVQWATMNVGATAPENYGDYYAWGETETRTTYSNWSNYKYCEGSESTLTKYNNNYSQGTVVDNKFILDNEDDVANVKWGGNWRMPTQDEFEELIDNCTWTWTTQNGVGGYRITSNKSGYTGSIFLPAAGYITDAQRGSGYGYYWSSSLHTSDPKYAHRLWFSSDGRKETGGLLRETGFTVRPVKP